MAQLVKPPMRFTHPEWTMSNNRKYRTAEVERMAAERLENESDRLIEETKRRTGKTEEDVNKKFDQRLDDINYWKDELDQKLGGLAEENDRLDSYIKRIEKALEAVGEPLHITQLCLVNRENRKVIDLVHDDVQKELMKEAEVHQGVQGLLQKTLEQAKEQLRLNRKAKYRLEKDIKDKCTAKNLDEYCAELKKNTPGIHFSDAASDIDINSVTPEQWQDFSNENLLNAESQRQNSVNMRSLIDGVLQQTANDQRQQKEAVDIAFARRISETKDTKGKLEEHLSRVLKEISNMDTNICNLEQAIAQKEQPLKLAQTRLEVRKERPNVELCRDPAHFRLAEEVTEIKTDIASLYQRLADSKSSLKALTRRQLDLEEDIQVKANTLFIDEVQCVGMRDSINLQSF